MSNEKRPGHPYGGLTERYRIARARYERDGHTVVDAVRVTEGHIEALQTGKPNTVHEIFMGLPDVQRSTVVRAASAVVVFNSGARQGQHKEVDIHPQLAATIRHDLAESPRRIGPQPWKIVKNS